MTGHFSHEFRAQERHGVPIYARHDQSRRLDVRIAIMIVSACEEGGVERDGAVVGVQINMV